MYGCMYSTVQTARKTYVLAFKQTYIQLVQKYKSTSYLHMHTHQIHVFKYKDTRPYEELTEIHTRTHTPTHIGMRTSYFCASTYVHRCTSNRVEDESGGVPDHKARRLEHVGHGRIVKDTHCRSHRTKATIIGIGEGWVREEYNKTEISSCSGNSIWSQNPKCKKTLPWGGEDAIQVHLRWL